VIGDLRFPGADGIEPGDVMAVPSSRRTGQMAQQARHAGRGTRF